MAKSMGEFPFVSQGRSWHIMLRAEGLRWTKALPADYTEFTFVSCQGKRQSMLLSVSVFRRYGLVVAG